MKDQALVNYFFLKILALRLANITAPVHQDGHCIEPQQHQNVKKAQKIKNDLLKWFLNTKIITK